MTRLKERIERLQIRYNLRREYFTVLVPAAIAVTFILAVILTGFADTGIAKAAQKEDPRQKAYEELLAQMNETEGGGAAADLSPAGTGSPTKKAGIDQFLIIAILVGIIPFAADTTLRKGKLRRKEELYTEFLFKLSELMRGGLDPIKAVKELAKTDLGILQPHVNLAAAGMTFGKSFEEGMRNMARSLESELIARYTELVIQASYSGGSVSDLILKSSEDMRTILEIEREKEGNLSQYTFIFYFAQGIIVFIAYTLTTSLLPFLQGMGASSFLGENQLVNLNFNTGFFHLVMINAFFGGLIIGKISEGNVKFGLKHVAVLMAGTYVICLFTLLAPPPPDVSPDVTISIVSGDFQEGLPNLPLKQPIIFQVLDKDGKPATGIDVAFTMVPSGKLNPAYSKTDRDGSVEVRVTLGEKGGQYVISAKAGEIVRKASVRSTDQSTDGG